MSNLWLSLKIIKFRLIRKSPFFEIFMRGKKVLDVGCGKAELLKNDKKNIFGLEINRDLVERAKSEGLKVIQGNVTHLPFEDNSFDVVFCRNVIEHLFPNEAYKMFKEIKRVLKGGGLILLISPMPKNIWNTFGHIKPYPPMAIKKLFRAISLESFNSIKSLEIKNILYFGSLAGSKATFLLSSTIANIFNLFRGSYLMVIRKKKNAQN